MRTNIVLDEKLMKEAFKYTKVTTKRELIDVALREFVKTHRRRDVRELIGEITIADNYDHKSLRAGKDEPKQ